VTESTGYKQRAEEMREDVIFMYRTGEHITRIATRSGYHVQTVKQIINKYERERG
jgi:transposase